jgi:hypothetical protein
MTSSIVGAHVYECGMGSATVPVATVGVSPTVFAIGATANSIWATRPVRRFESKPQPRTSAVFIEPNLNQDRIVTMNLMERDRPTALEL